MKAGYLWIWKGLFVGSLAGVVLLGANEDSQAAVVWTEAVNGDLSNNRLAPTALSLAVGSNLLTATSIGGAGIDREYVTFSMPPNSQLVALVMEAYAGNDGRAFIGVQSGTTLTVPPTVSDAAALLGYSLFGHADFNPGDDLLPSISQGAGSQQFTPPLPNDNYTFWIQQTAQSSTTYTLNFVVVPEPGILGLVGIALVAVGATNRRRFLRIERC